MCRFCVEPGGDAWRYDFNRLKCFGFTTDIPPPAHASFFAFACQTFPPSAEDYSPWTAYGLSKAANVLFSNEFHRRNYAFGAMGRANGGGGG